MVNESVQGYKFDLTQCFIQSHFGTVLEPRKSQITVVKGILLAGKTLGESLENDIITRFIITLGQWKISLQTLTIMNYY